ncbi:MAG: MoxR-like ATPase, partial [Thermoleophilaceae bacterium]|nr:MoxR-like ATPase [Thermoleophilaceae bacterium]
MSTPEISAAAVAEFGQRLRQNIARAVRVPDAALRDVVVSLVADGHVLIEDYPGVGKTALARALAKSIDAEFARVQCTSDLLPSDIVGTNVYNQRETRFEFRPGPVFANVVLVDEVNRASPK